MQRLVATRHLLPPSSPRSRAWRVSPEVAANLRAHLNLTRRRPATLRPGTQQYHHARPLHPRQFRYRRVCRLGPMAKLSRSLSLFMPRQRQAQIRTVRLTAALALAPAPTSVSSSDAPLAFRSPSPSSASSSGCCANAGPRRRPLRTKIHQKWMVAQCHQPSQVGNSARTCTGTRSRAHQKSTAHLSEPRVPYPTSQDTQSYHQEQASRPATDLHLRRILLALEVGTATVVRRGAAHRLAIHRV